MVPAPKRGRLPTFAVAAMLLILAGVLALVAAHSDAPLVEVTEAERAEADQASTDLEKPLSEPADQRPLNMPAPPHELTPFEQGGSYNAPLEYRRARQHVSPGLRVLNWLKDHQNIKGCWSPATFTLDSSRIQARRAGSLDCWLGTSDLGSARSEVRCTALGIYLHATLGFDFVEGDYREGCAAAMEWLEDQQWADGSFGSIASLRDNAIALMALAEMYGLSGKDSCKSMAEKALGYLLVQRTAKSGWGEFPGDEPDILSTGYAVIALKSAKLAGIDFKYAPVYSEVEDYLRLLAPDPSSPAVQFDASSSSSYAASPSPCERARVAQACWIYSMLVMGKVDLNDIQLKLMAEELVREDNLPVWQEGKVDLEYWWLGTLALYQVGGKCWRTWEAAASKALLENQRGVRTEDKGAAADELDEHGSWDSTDLWTQSTGRVGVTLYAGLVLDRCLTYQRMRKFHQHK